MFLRLSFSPSNKITGNYHSLFLYILSDCWDWLILGFGCCDIFCSVLPLSSSPWNLFHLQQLEWFTSCTSLFTKVLQWCSAFALVFSPLTSSLESPFTQAGSRWRDKCSSDLRNWKFSLFHLLQSLPHDSLSEKIRAAHFLCPSWNVLGVT